MIAPYTIGHKCKALCATCHELVSATFWLRDVLLKDLSAEFKIGTVLQILVSCCDDCDSVVGIPQQSWPRIQKEFRLAREIWV